MPGAVFPTGGHTTINDWFTGKSRPSPSNKELFVAVLGVCGVTDDARVEQWMQAWRRVRQNPGPRSVVEPYRGLETFQPEHAAWFFGREALTAQLVERLAALDAADGGIQVVVGPSGSGKSSLLRAGMIPAARQGAVPGSDRWRAVLRTPSTPLLESLALDADDAVSEGRLLLVVDQFEEVFTSCDDEDEQARFIAALCALAAPPHGALVVLGLRADFYARLLSYPDLVAAVRDGQVTVGPMSEAEFRRAITEPAQKAKLDIENGLVELLLRDVMPRGAGPAGGFGPGVLPLLSHALYATWRHEAGKSLTVAGYRETGGIDGAVATSADTIYRSLTPVQRELARRMFLSLVHVNPDSADTRRRVTMTQLVMDTGGEPDQLTDIVDCFVAQRLITMDAETVEVSHEALITAWPALRGWLETDRAGLVVRAQLTAAAAAWHREGRDPDGLYQGTRLAAAQGWSAHRRSELPQQTVEFLDASGRHAQRRTRRLYRSIAALLTLTITLFGVAAYALDQRSALDAQRQAAIDQRKDAVSRLVAGRANRLRETDPALARQLSLAAYRVAPTSEARSSLLDAYAGPAATRLGGFSQEVQSVVFSPDQRLLAAGSADGTVRLWEMSVPGAPESLGPPLTEPTAAIYTVAFSPNGRVLAAAGGDRQIYLWDLTNPQHPIMLGTPLSGPASTVYSVAFSPNGRQLVAGSANASVWRWDVSVPERSVPLPALTGPGAVQAVAFSPDGRLLAAGFATGVVRLWDAAETATPTPVTPDLAEHTMAIMSVAFSPDGTTLASGSKDTTVRLWDVSRPDRPTPRSTPMEEPTSWVNSVAFSPDSGVLAAGTSDKTVLLWDIDSGQVTETLPHPAQVIGLGFGADGQTVVTGSGDATVRVWHLPGPVLAGATDTIFNVSFGPDDIVAAASRDRAVRIWDVADPRRPVPLGPPLTSPDDAAPYAATTTFSPDGQLLAVGTRTGPIHLWNVSEPARPVVVGTPLTGHTELVETMAFSPDGTLLVAGGDDFSVSVWDVRDPAAPALRSTIPGTDAIINAVAVSPDGRTLAIGSTDNAVRLVDISNPSRPSQREALPGFTGYVYSVAFSADGRTLAAGSADRTIRLWDVTSGGPAVPLDPPLTGPSGNVYWVAFGPDGHTLAAAAGDNTVWLWDTTDPRRPSVIATLTGLISPARTLAFASSSQTLATAGEDRRVHLWELDPEQVAAWVCDTAGDTISVLEWNQYVPNETFVPPC